jgi:hypothetical protein
MSTKIPESLKADLPATKWGKVLAATPVVMTVIATLLAGLSNGEMTKAQYSRALAAQQQSKAGDQWGFFQAKRLRSAIQSGTLDVVQITGGDHAIDGAALHAFAATLPDPAAIQDALTLLLAGKLPASAAAPALDPAVKAALDGIEHALPDAELTPLLNAVRPETVTAAIRAAQQHTRDFDALLQPVVRGGDRLGDAIDAGGSTLAPLRRDFAELRLRYSTMRYDAEAGLNRAVANLLEVQVRQSNLTAERHQRRSQRFFYGMLGAQAAVIIATFAMAARKRNLLWSLAATAGLGALSFAAYVFLYL